MKDLSPREVALFASGSIALVLLIVLAVAQQTVIPELSWYWILALPLIAFGVNYIVLNYIIERFIYRKVKLIYKTIHNLKAPKGAPPIKIDMNDDILNEVENEVLDWATNKAREIENLKRTENYRKEFIGNVSHELKTPIFNIQGYLHTLIDGGIEDDKVNRSYLYKASKNVDRLTAIVDDLETITKLETSSMVLDITRFDIIELINEVFEAQEMQADVKDIQLKFKEATPKGVKVLADRDRIRQVLTNLVTNSIKYGTEGGETLAGVYDMHDNILVEITDNGIGITEQDLPRLFERFYRADKSRSREMGGTGLGLSIVKHIIEAHKQTINVRSTEHVGSTFGFTLKKA